MKKLSVDNSSADRLPGMYWRKTGYPYMVRSDGGGLNTKISDCNSLTEARRVAKREARRCNWSEIFRWSENGVMIKPVFIASYCFEEVTQCEK